jgi:hypothetical protein
MRVRLTQLQVALAALVVAGCQEQNAPLRPGPEMQVAPSSGTTCDFKSLSQFATHYFSSGEAKVVRNILSAMQSAGAFTAVAQDSGFSVMSHIAANITAGNSDVADASSLTNGLLACMYNDPEALPATFPEDFSVATNPALKGAYAVRGGTADANYVVYSRPLGSSFSGVGPSATNATASWNEMLDSFPRPGNPAPNRILLYGMPGSTQTTYDWRVVPRNTTFNPPAVVAVCLDPTTGDGLTSLLHEEHVGLLPYVQATWLGVPPSCSTPMAALTSSGPLQFASRAAKWGLGLFTPEPLSAENSVVPDGLGGTTGGARSEFGAEQVDNVTLTFTVQPTDVQVNSVITPPVVVQATNPITGSTVANVSITLSAVNNNGTPAVLSGTLTQVTDYSGNATFADLSESKTGGYVLVASGFVGGRDQIVVGTATSDRFNVRP